MKTSYLLIYGLKDLKPDNSFNSLDALIRKEEPDIVILSEFDFIIKEVIDNIQLINLIAVNHNCSILLTPNSYKTDKVFKCIEWSKIRSELINEDVIVDDDNNKKTESVGLWFDANGDVYGFPKLWHLKPVHKIRDGIAVSICGEISHITTNSLDDVSILYNPSHESDDIYVKGRNMDWYGKTQEEILSNYCWLTKDETLYKINKDSFYLNEALKQKGLPVIRCDSQNCTGLLQRGNMNIAELDYTNVYCKLVTQ